MIINLFTNFIEITFWFASTYAVYLTSISDQEMSIAHLIYSSFSTITTFGISELTIKNDTGLYVEALGGFPGPYTHYVDERLGEDGLLKLLEGVDNRNACFMEAFAYCEYGKDPIVFKSITKGKIAKEKSGTYGWSWDFIFIPDGYDKTMGNYPDEERCHVWNTDAYTELADYLKNKED